VLLTPNRNQPQQQQQSVKVVKVFSSLPSASQSQTAPKPLVQIVPSPQGQLQQQGNRVVADVSPRVVSVQSLQQGQSLQVNQAQPIRIDGNAPSQQKVTVQNLVLSSGHKIHLQTPITQDLTSKPRNAPTYQVRALPLQPSQQQQQQRQQQMQIKNTNAVTLQTTPVSQNQLPQQINAPVRSSAISSSYKPLESLQEVNRQATQGSVVSPVSAVIPEAKEPTKQSPTEIRNQVTVRDRYRYIVPTPQTSSMAVTTAAAGPGTQLVQTSPVNPAIPAGVQPVNHAAVNPVLQVQIKQEPKHAVPVSPLPSTGPNIQISQVHSGAPAVAASTGLIVKVKTEKEDRPMVNGIKRAHDDDDVIEQPVVQKPRMETEVIVIDSPPPPPQEEETFEPVTNDNELALEGVDNDLIIKLGKLSKEEQWIKLAQSAQQLRHLRDNVCKLLRVLVPEIELGDKSEILDDTKVDNLLKQVLEANLNTDTTQS